MSAPTRPPSPPSAPEPRAMEAAPADTLDAYGLSCGRLEPLIAQRLRVLAPGQVLEIRSDQPEARDGIGAWVWLTGHALVAVEDEEPPRARYYVKKKSAGTREL